MKRLIAVVVLLLIVAGLGVRRLRASGKADEAPVSRDPSLTIYNQNFAVVRQYLPLDLQPGVNTVNFTNTTAHLEPDSVILRDPRGERRLQVLEQNYRADPLSQELLLSLNEGKLVDFKVNRNGKEEIVKGKIIRSGYVPHYSAMSRYGSQYAYQQQYAAQAGGQPIVELDGLIHFGLPGQPLFPSLGQDTILKPTLGWLLATDKPGAFDAELSYVTGGMRWEADYNLVAPENGDTIDLVGWVTLDNQSGKTFERARIRLMAGDVHKIQRNEVAGSVMAAKAADMAMSPAVTERSFDEYHLYTLQRQVTLRDREIKQVEFVGANGVRSQKLYVYDGAAIDWNRYSGWSAENLRLDSSYGTQSNPKIWVMQELKNTAANHLGIALPRGRMRFYRRDEDGRLQFTGENMIDHTPANETVRLYTGNAFDLVGERRRTNFSADGARHFADETFEISVRNHKKEPVTVRVVEHLYRCTNWQIVAKTAGYTKKDAQTVEFPVTIAPEGEQKITYTVHYWW